MKITKSCFNFIYNVFNQVAHFSKHFSNHWHKSQLKEFNVLLSHLKGIFAEIGISDFLFENPHVEFRSYSNEIRIESCNRYDEEISHLLRFFPNAEIETHLNYMNIMYIKCNYDSAIRLLKSTRVVYKPIVSDLEEICNHFKSNITSDSFNGIMNKYEDTFSTLNMTIDEINKSSEMDHNHKTTIVEIMQTFIDEYSSLKKLYEGAYKIDEAAIQNSLKSRLEDELKLVQMIKTDWT